MQRIADGSVDVILTDPPYLYLKNQKLDRPFDENVFFNEAKRVLKKDGFIVMFGRGTSFYRWNTILANLGFNFKEEFIWDKCYCTSPLMAISRVHETISTYTKDKGTINKVKVPYLEMKKHDIDGIVTDIKRLRVCLKNTKSLDSVLAFLENNKMNEKSVFRADYEPTSRPNNIACSKQLPCGDRQVNAIQSVCGGMNERSIIRTDRYDTDKFTKHGVNADQRKSGDRQGDVIQSVCCGMNEKDIIKQRRDNYNTIHPTQKPVRLLERLLALVSREGDLILDPFSGSGSTAIAAINTGRNFIGFEIDKEYYELANERIKNEQKQTKLSFN
jgi:site-specific DNA-methyltransferase (adenine-specific)